MNRKEEIIKGLVGIRGRIRAVVSDLPLEKHDEVFLGTWSVKDLLAHLIGWDYTNMEAVRELRQGEAPTVFQHWDPDWVQYNARLVEKHKKGDLREILDSLERSHGALLEFVKTIPAGDIEKDFGIRSPDGNSVTVEEILQFEIEDEDRHYQQIRDWIGNR